ncbi:hypothetical protein [Halorussus marinus]|uniref:hypothetical protein n=1 Tax=Halorussus marinus TaxID=2505976 RepID=UPI00109194CB|nr:hypothetical protein [Halorussus marinus]
MPESIDQDDSDGDDQIIEGETATITVRRMGPLASREYEIELDGGLPLGTIKQEAREKAHEDGLDVFQVTQVNEKMLRQIGGGFYDTQPEDQGPGGESA